MAKTSCIDLPELEIDLQSNVLNDKLTQFGQSWLMISMNLALWAYMVAESKHKLFKKCFTFTKSFSAVHSWKDRGMQAKKTSTDALFSTTEKLVRMTIGASPFGLQF